jgi:hypothetical protein
MSAAETLRRAAELVEQRGTRTTTDTEENNR